MVVIRGVLLHRGDIWMVCSSGGSWPIDGCVGIDEGAYVEGAAESRRVDATSLSETKPTTFEEAVDQLLLSPRFPHVGWYDARRIVKSLGPSAAEHLRKDPWLLEGLVSRPRHVISVWAGLGTVYLPSDT